jgi:hypothetical protein
MGVEERLLDQVSGVDFSLEATADLESGEQGQVGPISLQKLPQGRAIPRPTAEQKLLENGLGPGIHPRVLSIAGCQTEAVRAGFFWHERLTGVVKSRRVIWVAVAAESSVPKGLKVVNSPLGATVMAIVLSTDATVCCRY